MKTFYRVDNNTGYILDNVPIFLIMGTHVCKPDILFLKSLQDNKKVTIDYNYLDSFVVSGLRVQEHPCASSVLMPIIVDESFTDVITGIKFECDKASSKFIKIDREIDPIIVDGYFKSLEKISNGIELYLEAVKSFAESLEYYKNYFMNLEEQRLKEEEAEFEQKYSSSVESIEQFKIRARKRLEENKKN